MTLNIQQLTSKWHFDQHDMLHEQRQHQELYTYHTQHLHLMEILTPMLRSELTPQVA